MKLKLILTLLAGLTVFDPACSDESIKRSEYNRMPPMFVYDQYDECLFSDPDEVVGTYCMVRVVVKPDNASSIWRLIETFSSNTKLHMNHALLDRGICVIDVAETIARLKVDNISALVVPKFEIEFPYIYRYNSFRNVEPYKKNYSDLMAAIVNTDLTERYGLQAYTEIEYCDRTGVDEFPIDGVDIAFLVFIADLIIAVIASSYYDASWKSSNGLKHYQKDLPCKKSMLLSSFSLTRNWYRLVSSSRDPTSRELRFIQAVRFLAVTLVVYAHAAFFVQPRNGWVIEQTYHDTVSMIVANASQLVTTFFFISALVFTVTFVKKIKDSGRTPGLMEIAVIIVNRYIRPRRFGFWYDAPSRSQYFPAYMYLGVYVSGIIIGFVYLKHRIAGKGIRSNMWFRVAFLSIFIIAPAMFLSSRIFYEYEFPKPSVWMSVYSAGSRVLMTILIALGFFGITFQVSKTLTRFLNHKIFEVLGRLTYGTYLVHYCMVKIMFFNVRELSNLGMFDLIVKTCATMLISTLASLALVLMIELPISALQKQLLQTFLKPLTHNNNNNNNNEPEDTERNAGYTSEESIKLQPKALKSVI
ncbi:conserved hypothetical protein [Culex quinquefasciatus]|uniref:Uncharacterized protein n=1 Tax=Culex quinquefasciatus TaxID=7176 RepID=B0XK31_CULQU|nr:conserved hypothetical protein [Culex quinquefasciatus]|eukprot:XP_001870003.1 conserved hypothetical protein [Culex quinquefasciatus]